MDNYTSSFFSILLGSQSLGIVSLPPPLVVPFGNDIIYIHIFKHACMHTTHTHRGRKWREYYSFFVAYVVFNSIKLKIGIYYVPSTYEKLLGDNILYLRPASVKTSRDKKTETRGSLGCMHLTV